MIQQEIIDIIEQYNDIIIHHHVSPDPDTIGSQLGLKYILEATYPEKHIYATGLTNDRTAFLGDMDVVPDELFPKSLVIIVDVGDKKRIDDARFLQGKELIKIDHHPLTETFAKLDWVDTSFASATEMIMDIYMHNQDRLVMNEKAARVLYAGTLTDTGRFYYNSVTERTLRYGAEIYKFGFDKQALYADLYYKTQAEVKFIGFLMNHFSYTENGFAYMKITQEILDEYQVPVDFASGMVNTLANIKEVIMWMFFTEDKELGKIRTSFRSRGPIVNKLAAKYGGGGHIWASGTLSTDWEMVDEIIKDADLLCKEFNKV